MTWLIKNCVILASALLIVIALNGVEMQIRALQNGLNRASATSQNLDRIAAAIPQSALRATR